MDLTVETLEYRGLTIHIEYDQDPESPREWDNLSVMACFHLRYRLGDMHDFDPEHYEDLDEVRQAIMEEHSPTVILPLYLNDHSGISMHAGADILTNPGPNAGGWDTSVVGWAFDTPETRKMIEVEDRFGRLSAQCIAWIIEGEVKTYSQYLEGDIYGYLVEDEDGEVLDSCWGFYGIDDAISEAKAAADWDADRIAEKRKQELIEEMESSATYAWTPG